jgi:hypothetical protein
VLESPPVRAAREISSYKKVMFDLVTELFYRDSGIESSLNEE